MSSPPDLNGFIDAEWLFAHPRLMLVCRNGLGDQIVSAGLAVWMSKHVQTVFVPGRVSNFKTMSWVFKDIPNIIPVGVNHTANIQTLDAMCVKLDCEQVWCVQGFQVAQKQVWMRACYSQYHLPYDARWEYWPDPPPGPLAQYVYDQVVYQPHYMVVHATSSERAHYNINTCAGRDAEELQHMQVVHVDASISNNLWDWYLVLQNATEIHMVDSSIFRMCEQMGSHLKGRVYFHNLRYVDYTPDYARDIQPWNPEWVWVDYPFKKWRQS